MEDLLCPECKNPFSLNLRVPKTLDCLHTFCVKCLKLEHTEQGRPFVLCLVPTCGAQHYLNDRGEQPQGLEHGLKTDHFIERASSCYQTLRSSSSGRRCGRCPNEAKDYYCEKCRVLLCQMCCDDHGRADKTKTHVVKDFRKVLQEAEATGEIAPFVTKESWKCERHSGEPEERVQEATVYCFVCEAMVCVTCAASECGTHVEKKKASRILAGKEEKFNIEPRLEKLRGIGADYDQALHSVDSEIERFETACRLAMKRVEETTENLHQRLLAEQEALLKKVKRIEDARVEEINAKLEEFEDAGREMSHSIEFAKNALLCIPEDILEQEEALLERLDQLCQKYERHPLEPVQRDVFVRSMDPDVNLDGATGQVYTNPNLDSLTEGFEHVAFRQGKKTEFILTCRDSMGTLLPETNFEVALAEVRPDAEKFPVKKNPNGTFSGTLQPCNSGEHPISLEVQFHEGEAVQLAPFTIFVSPALPAEMKLVKKISRGMVRPAAIALGKQYIAVTDKEAHKVFILALDGQRVNVVGEQGENEGEFNLPHGVDWWGENLVVADTGNDRVQVLSAGGEVFRVIGGYGGHYIEFIEPRDVAVSVSEDAATIFVADSVNYRIQFFRMANVKGEVELLGTYTLQNKPLSLSVGDWGRVFVTENLTSQFKILSLKCQPGLEESHMCGGEPPQSKHTLELFQVCDKKENAEQPLDHIRGLTYDPQTRFVLATEEGNPNISVFDRDGRYVGAVRLPREVTTQMMVNISAFDSCVVAVGYKGEKYAIFVLRFCNA